MAEMTGADDVGVDGRALSPWTQIAQPGRYGAPALVPGVVALLEQETAMTQIAARRGGMAALERWAQAELDIALPSPGRMTWRDGLAVIWSGPEKWLVVGAPGATDFARAPALCVNQGHAVAMLTLAGPHRRDALAKGCMVDIHPDAFADGAVALTSIAHINLQLWRKGETFVIAVPRSLAGSFWHWLEVSAAEFGFEVRG
jgi:methylglutamate dehydrogenase subunit D